MNVDGLAINGESRQQIGEQCGKVMPEEQMGVEDGVKLRAGASF